MDHTFCTSYNQYIDNVGWVEPDFDSKFNAVRTFSVIANVFGFMAWLTIAMASCCPLAQQRLNGMSIYFLIASLFQGLTLLLFRSDVCEVYVMLILFEVNWVEGLFASLSFGPH